MVKGNIYQIGSETAWQDLGGGICRQIFGYDEKIMMVKVKFEQGAVGVLHQHPHTQISYVESGSFEADIDGEKKILVQGDGFYVPSNAMHGVVCLTPGILVDVFSPHREDFL